MKKNIAFKYGGIGGLIIVSTWFISALFMEESVATGSQLVGYLIMLLALTTVFFGVKKVRDEYGYLTFKDGLINGLGIVLVASIIYVVGWMIYMPALAPDFADEYTAAQIEMVQSSDASQNEKEQEIEELQEMMDNYKKPHIMAAFTFLEIFPVGLIVAVVAALILRKKGPQKNE